MSDKKPYLFYFEEAENAWIPAPEKIDEIISAGEIEMGDSFTINFIRKDMTEEEFENLPEI